MKWPKFRTIAICLGLFLVFLILRFPFSNLKSYVFAQVHKNTGISILFADDLYLTLLGWPGIGMKNAEVLVPVGETELDIVAKAITARVGIGSLFPPSLSFSIAMDGLQKGGDVYVKLSRVKQDNRGLTQASVYLKAEKVDLSQFPLDGQELKGKVGAEASMELNMTDLAKTQGTVALNVDGFLTPAAVPGGYVVPSIQWGDIKSKIQVKNGVVELSNFQFGNSSSDFSGQFGGEIRLGQTLLQSALNITMKIQISESFSKNSDAASFVTILDNFDQRQPGRSYNLKWNQPFSLIAQNFLDAGPVALP